MMRTITVADRVLAFRRLSRLLLALCLIVAALPMAAPPSPASASHTIDPNAYYKIVARHSGKLLDVADVSTADGANVQQWSDTGGSNQQWRFVDVGSGYYKIVARHSGKLLDVNARSTADGANVIQWSDTGATNQQWSLVDVSGGYVKIVARHSGKLLEVNAFSTADGANVQQWTDNGGSNQQWSLVQVGGGSSGSCEDFASITMGKYWINNNVWGQDSGSGWQCIWSNSVSGSTINWGTNWDWSGQSNSVKSYASAVLGWHWGWKLSNTGLPVQLSANRNISTSWSYRVTLDGANTMNVAYDLWLHTISNPDSDDQPTDEVMIWLYRSGGAGPAGTRQATVTIAGTTWDLYRGWIAIDANGNGWNVYSFVRTSNTTSATLNLRDFLNHLVSRGWLSSSKYLNSVQAGTEVFIGKGQLDNDSYSVTIE